MAPSDFVAQQFRAFSSTFAEISAWRSDLVLLNGVQFRDVENEQRVESVFSSTARFRCFRLPFDSFKLKRSGRYVIVGSVSLVRVVK